jgi:3-phenylpropionate/cinnamic acid dioxygenase small subunit
MKNIIEQKHRLEEERLSLMQALSEGDYKIIKCAEAQSVGEEMPYDAAALHSERQALRDRINEIETEMSELVETEPEDEE